MANEKAARDDGTSGAAILEKAKNAIDKGRRESLEARLKGHVSKRSEHERAINQIDGDIAKDIADFEDGR